MKPTEIVLDYDAFSMETFNLGLVVFDRDDTLVKDAGQHNNPSQLAVIEDVIPILRTASEIGFGIAVASNQSGIESGKFSVSQLNEFNRLLKVTVLDLCSAKISVIASCPHTPSSLCECRKPKTGLFEAIEGLSIGRINIFVGNSHSDQLAAANFGIPYIDINLKSSKDAFMDWARSYEAC